MAVTFEKVASIQKVKIVESGMPDKFISPNYNVLADRLLEVVYITSDAIGASDYSSGYSYSITEINNRPSNDKDEVAEWLATNFFNFIEQTGGGGISTVTVDNFPDPQNVEVQNFPASQTIDGSVSVDNFPANQTISGSVSVDNLPASQTVDGTVSVDNFPASQTIDGTVNIGNLADPQNVNIKQGGVDLSLQNGLPIQYQDSASLSAFGRLRTAQEQKKIEISAIDGKQPLFVNEVIGGGVSNTSTVVNSTVEMNADNLGYVIRQTKQRAVYQKGNSQLVLLTFDSFDLQFNIEKRVGYFTSSTTAPYTANRDGIFLLSDGSNYSIVQSKNGTETAITQSNWNVDTFDGNGASGITIDFSQRNILVMDLEWLGVGRVRVGFNIGGITYIAHEFLNANNGTGVYILNGSKPLRWEVRSVNALTAGNFTQICGSVSSEGAQNQLGKVRSTEAQDFQANSAGTLYGVQGIRIQSGKDFCQIDLKRISALAETNDDFIAYIMFNPTVTNQNAFTAEFESVLEATIGNDGGGGGLSEVTDTGAIIGILHGRGDRSIQFDIPSELRLGTNLDGTRDEIWLGIRPISAGLDIWTSLTWQEQI